MKIACIGGGPAGLYFAILMKKANPAHEITVYERNRPYDTFGWGVVFSDQTLENLSGADEVTKDEIIDSFAHWDDIEVHFKGRVITSSGHAFCGIERKRLLNILQHRAEDLGVELAFETEIAGLDPFSNQSAGQVSNPAIGQYPGADLIIAADGINSRVRTNHADHFQPDIAVGDCKFIWLGTHKVFEAFTFLFEETEWGWFTTHAYRFNENTSTFIVEAPESVWAAAGLAEADTDASIAFCERLFGSYLDGHQLMSNARHLTGSPWINFARVLNKTWVMDNVVLMGDAAHSAHFSIGSGTKLALEDAIALSRAFADHGDDVPAALAAYESERQLEALRLQSAARNSMEWFENVSRYASLAPEQFTYSLLTRSQRVSHENLRLRDRRYLESVETWLAQNAASPAPNQAAPNQTAPNQTAPNRASQNRASQNQTAPDQAAQNRTSQNRASQNRASQNRTSQNQTAPDQAAQNQIEPNREAPDRESPAQALPDQTAPNSPSGSKPVTKPVPPMFTPFRLRGMEVVNRVVVSPMAMYSAEDGMPGAFHQVHLGSRALGGAGLVFTEMTCVSAEGRITPGCAGIYTDAQAQAWKSIVDFAHRHSRAKMCLQLGHSGPKGSTKLGWEGMDEPLDTGNWEIIGASPVPWSPRNPVPRPATRADMDKVIADFAAATKRAVSAGFDMVELHAAHGYLLSAFLSPLSNRRDDEYGGSLANRMRFPLQVVAAIRAEWPEDRPLSVRISATDWHPEGLQPEAAVDIARMFKESGVDIIDVSAGQTSTEARPVYGRMFQTPFSDRIRNEAGIATIAVGNIYETDHVNSIIAAGRADLVALARPHLADPNWVLHAAARQGYTDQYWPPQYLNGKEQYERLLERGADMPVIV